VTGRPGRSRPFSTRAAAGPASPSRDAGRVTAEFAVALPAFVIVLLAALTAVGVVTAQLRCADAAAVAARMAARDESAGVVRTTAMAAAPAGATLSVLTTTSTVTAVVRAHVAPAGILRFLPGVTVQARVVQAREPAAPGAAESLTGGAGVAPPAAGSSP
jgi:Flp pilus assembly protein TadG